MEMNRTNTTATRFPKVQGRPTAAQAATIRRLLAEKAPHITDVEGVIQRCTNGTVTSNLIFDLKRAKGTVKIDFI